MQAGGGRLSLSTDGDKCAMVIFFGGWGGWTKSYISMYLLYIVFLSFSQKILARYTLARLRFILNLQMQYVLPTPFIYNFHFFVSFSLTASFQSSLKTRIKLHKIVYEMKCPKLFAGVGWLGVIEAWRKGEGESWKWGERHGCWGDRCPCMQVSWTMI